MKTTIELRETLNAALPPQRYDEQEVEAAIYFAAVCGNFASESFGQYLSGVAGSHTPDELCGLLALGARVSTTAHIRLNDDAPDRYHRVSPYMPGPRGRAYALWLPQTD